MTGGAVGVVTGVVSVTSPASAALVTDNCGYSTTATPLFNESTVTRAALLEDAGLNTSIHVITNDETALLLGVNGASAETTNNVAPFYSNVANPSLGATTLDAYLRPQYPALFITDITNDPSSKAGDWQVTTGARQVTDGVVTKLSDLFNSATAAFTSADVGRQLSDATSGKFIPAGTTILQVKSSTQVQMSAKATGSKTGDITTIAGTPQPSNLAAGAPFADAVGGTWATATQNGTNYTVVKPTNKNNWDFGLEVPQTPWEQITGATVTAGSKTLTSAKPEFQASEKGMAIDDANGGKKIATGTTITDVVSSTQVTLSAAATGSMTNDTVEIGDFSSNPDVTYTSLLGTTGNEGFGSDVAWNVNNPGLRTTDGTNSALTPGHTYRIQVMTHDGDQNKTGGDVGEFCTQLHLPGPPAITTQPSADISPNISTNTDFQMQAPLASSITDYAVFTGTDGPLCESSDPSTHACTSGETVTFKLYFSANPQPTSGVCSTPASAPPGTLVATYANQTLTLDPVTGNATATSPAYDTSADDALGLYYWQDTYNATDPPQTYTSMTEPCGREVVQMMNARVSLSPHYAVNNLAASSHSHTITASVQTTTDGTAYSPVGGAPVTFSYVGTTSATPAPPTGCNTGTAGTCTTTIDDTVAELIQVHASSTDFEQTPSQGWIGNLSDGNVGTFTKTTDSSAACTSPTATGATCDALKRYFQPATNLTASDKLLGLPSSANGTVSYKYWLNDPTCSGSGTSAGGGGAVSAGVAPSSGDVTVAPSDTAYFEASYVKGTDGTPSTTTSCTAESVTAG